MDELPKRNLVKMKALSCLAPDRWDSTIMLSAMSGVTPGSLRVLLKRWSGWGLVVPRHFSSLLMSDGRQHTLYCLGKRGAIYLKQAPAWYPFWVQIKVELARIEEKGFDTVDIPAVRRLSWLACPGAANRMDNVGLVCLPTGWYVMRSPAFVGDFRVANLDEAIVTARSLYQQPLTRNRKYERCLPSHGKLRV